MEFKLTKEIETGNMSFYGSVTEKDVRAANLTTAEQFILKAATNAELLQILAIIFARADNLSSIQKPHCAKTAIEFLEQAAGHMKDRVATYDKPEGERSMGNTVAAFNIITGHSLREAEGWLLMQILKDVRQWSRPSFHRDSAEDCVAYSALKAEALANE